MMKKRTILLLIIVFSVLFVIFSYAKVEILSINAEEKLASFNISSFDNIYCEGTPTVYDRLIYNFKHEGYAKVLYVLCECEFGVMAELRWNSNRDCWELEDYQTMWTVHGGSAQEFYWPLYYVDKLFPLLED